LERTESRSSRFSARFLRRSLAALVLFVPLLPLLLLRRVVNGAFRVGADLNSLADVVAFNDDPVAALCRWRGAVVELFGQGREWFDRSLSLMFRDK
jgi:hypothetical protein